MATLGGYYLNPHVSQFDGSALASENCTPTSGANGANASTGGRIHETGAQVRALVPRSQETDPATPGWSLPDLDHAMAKLGVPFTNRTDTGFAAAWGWLESGHYLAMQGESYEFSNATCSGAFNGPHCIGIHPAHRITDGLTQHWIDDPICPTGRYEFDYVIHRYGGALDGGIRYGTFDTPVPRAAAPGTTWWPDYAGTPPITATFAVQFRPGTYPTYNSDGTRHGSFTTAGGFTAYGNGRRLVGARLIGRLITVRPGIWIDVHSANGYWSKH